MVRPIELTDAVSKSHEVGRLQQNLQHNPEVVAEFQKSMNEREKVHNLTAPVPVPQKDEVVLHTDKEDKENRHGGEKHHPGTDEETANNGDNPDEAPPAGHIDILA
jgi:hypothetical protein